MDIILALPPLRFLNRKMELRTRDIDTVMALYLEQHLIKVNRQPLGELDIAQNKQIWSRAVRRGLVKRAKDNPGQ